MSDVTLTKMEITNYRSCVDTTFEPNPNLSVLIGPNGSGKTTVLSAFQLLSKLLESILISQEGDGFIFHRLYS
ncbi:AAA family ATPase [Pseudomonas syringae]|nr:AAA family ATPase [Pseudomonas syringae]